MLKCKNNSIATDLESTFITFILFSINDVIIYALSHLSIIAKLILKIIINLSHEKGNRTIIF